MILQRMEAGFLVQFHSADQAEAIHLVDEPGVVAHADEAAEAVELAQRVHPDAVILFPERLVGGSPADEVRPVVGGVGAEILFERGMQQFREPGLRLRALQVAAGFVDVERRVPGHVCVHHGLAALR